MGMFSSIFGGGSKSSSSPSPSEKYEPKPYVPSEYDAPASKSIFDFYDPRIKGEKLGYAKEDLDIMEGQAQDHATRNMNEAISRGAAGRRQGTGGTWTGGRDVMRDDAINKGLEYRSNAMRDIAVRNAVLKHNDQWNAAAGMGNFLGNERSHALAQWSGNQQGEQAAYQYNNLYPMLFDQQENQYNRSADFENSAEWAKIAINLFDRYQKNGTYKQ